MSSLTYGLPHSDTPESSDIGSSPGLFAAYHVLLRLVAPKASSVDPFSLDHIILLIPTLLM